MINPERQEATSIETLQPGNVVEFGDITELAAFEDIVALPIATQIEAIFPYYHKESAWEAWSGRTALKELVRPEKPAFNGTVGDIKLTVMDNAYARILDANDRGWQFQRGHGSLELSNEYTDLLTPLYEGFVLTALAKSTGRGVIGQIQAELWYAPASISTQVNRTSLNLRRSTAAGAVVRRFITKPKLETEAFIALDEESRKIGFQTLQKNMRHPIIQPMSQ